jgi:hypothetical protein
MAPHSSLDWNQIWVEQQQKHMACGETGNGWWIGWQEKTAALTYWEKIKSRSDSASRCADLQNLLQPDWRLLDIGAGPGNLAIPLAKQCAHVTAVEPAAGMRAVFQDQLKEEPASNITIVPKTWDEIDPLLDLQPPYHLTVVSYALGMFDLKTAIEKMIAVTSHYIIIYWHASEQAWDVDALHLWPLLWQKEYTPVPKCNILFNLLYSMGIYPEVRAISSESRTFYASFQEALNDYCTRFKARSEAQVEILRTYLSERLEKKGTQWVRCHQQVSMRISWSPH